MKKFEMVGAGRYFDIQRGTVVMCIGGSTLLTESELLASLSRAMTHREELDKAIDNMRNMLGMPSEKTKPTSGLTSISIAESLIEDFKKLLSGEWVPEKHSIGDSLDNARIMLNRLISANEINVDAITCAAHILKDLEVLESGRWVLDEDSAGSSIDNVEFVLDYLRNGDDLEATATPSC